MTDQELYDKIRKSAETVLIPRSLSPESIEIKLHSKKRYLFLKSASAAALLLCFILSVSLWNIGKNPQQPENPVPVSTESIIEDTVAMRENAGELYTLADSYEEIYTFIKNNLSSQEDTSSRSSLEYAAVEDSSDLQASAEKKTSYSSTNLQTDGVDEGDIIKTDGTCIYTVTNGQVHITDASNGTLTKASVIKPDLDASDIIEEMYVDDGRLILIIQHYDTSLEEQESDTEEYTTVYDNNNGFIPICNAGYKIDASYQTIVFIYDISNPKKPELFETFKQDGSYKTSRKTGDILYLFTEENLADTNNFAKYESGKGNFLPLVNGETIPCDSIYLPSEGNCGLIISSINVDTPQEIVDKVMIIHNFVNIYVSTNSLYLYRSNYQNNITQTEIAKFSIHAGKINAVGASSVKGEVCDTFAINDYQGNLRILTTLLDSDGNYSNQLYLFDTSLNQTGSLTDIAKGEEIYAARYFNHTAYFITYRNTDPLFAVDLSDEYNPKLLGQLKITGFSEYLHFWGKDKLLGIGYETDPDTGSTQGIKLVMFDISNPAELNILDTLVLSDARYSPALYDYKCILADETENIIGFAAEYNSDYSFRNNYLVYSWEDGHFISRLKENFNSEISSSDCRGLYIGDRFYIADTYEIISFNRTKDYEKIQNFTLNP